MGTGYNKILNLVAFGDVHTYAVGINDYRSRGADRDAIANSEASLIVLLCIGLATQVTTDGTYLTLRFDDKTRRAVSRLYDGMSVPLSVLNHPANTLVEIGSHVARTAPSENHPPYVPNPQFDEIIEVLSNNLPTMRPAPGLKPGETFAKLIPNNLGILCDLAVEKFGIDVSGSNTDRSLKPTYIRNELMAKRLPPSAFIQPTTLSLLNVVVEPLFESDYFRPQPGDTAADRRFKLSGARPGEFRISFTPLDGQSSLPCTPDAAFRHLRNSMEAQFGTSLDEYRTRGGIAEGTYEVRVRDSAARNHLQSLSQQMQLA